VVTPQAGAEHELLFTDTVVVLCDLSVT
jgi:hypothetical protein